MKGLSNRNYRSVFEGRDSVPSMRLRIVRTLQRDLTISRLVPSKGTGLENPDCLASLDGFLEGFFALKIELSVHIQL